MSKKDSPAKDIEVKPVTRDTLRASLLGSPPKPKKRLITLFGQEVELRQPSFRGILSVRNNDDPMDAATDAIINYAYVPGTDEKIFEPTDRDVMLNWPFTEDLLSLQVAIMEMTGVKIDVAEEVLKENPLSKQS